MQKFLHKALLGLAIVCLSIGLIVPAQLANAAPQSFTDISSNHWAIGPISQWNNLGLVGGYTGNTFRPNQPITKAEFIAFVNRGFGFTKQAEINFADVKLGSWFYADIAKAIGRGYAVVGDSAAFQPNKPLSRLEAAQMLHTILRLEPVAENALARFTDVGNLTEAERAMVNSIVANHYLGGYTNNTLRLNSTITRAEMIAILSRGAGEIMNVATTFGPETGTRTINGNATISKSGTTLRNTVVKGDLYITEGVGEGDFYLNNVKVEGRTIVAGGGSNSGHVEGSSQLAYLMITYPDGSTHMVFEDEASVDEVEFRSSGDVDTSSSTSETRPAVTLRNLPAGSVVTAVGNFSNVNVDAPGVTLVMGEGSSAENVTATPTAAGTTLNIQGNVTGTVAVNAPSATTTVAQTATVANVTTGETATGSTTNVQGSVTGALTVNAPNATAAVTGTVNQVTTGTTATGSNLNVTGTVTTLALNAPQTNTTITGSVSTVQANASGQLNLGAGANVGAVQVAPGTSELSVARDPNAKVDKIEVPADTTITLDGKEQTGTITPPPPSGGGSTGGGDTPPASPTISTIKLVKIDKTIVSIAIGGLNKSVDLGAVGGITPSTHIEQLTIEGSSPASIVKVNSVLARGMELPLVQLQGTGSLTMDVTELIGPWEFLKDLKPNDGSWEFDGDMAISTLHGILGTEFTVNGQVGDRVFSIEITLPGAPTPVPTPWGGIDISDDQHATMTVTRDGTILDGNYSDLMASLGGVMWLSGLEPSDVTISKSGHNYGTFDYDDAGLGLMKDAICQAVGKDQTEAGWSTVTLGDLGDNHVVFTFNVTNAADQPSEYVVSFTK